MYSMLCCGRRLSACAQSLYAGARVAAKALVREHLHTRRLHNFTAYLVPVYLSQTLPSATTALLAHKAHSQIALPPLTQTDVYIRTLS